MTRRRSIRPRPRPRAPTTVRRVERARPSSRRCARGGTGRRAAARARPPTRTGAPCSVVRQRRSPASALGGRAGVRVDEVEVRAVGDARRRGCARGVRSTWFQPMCGSVGASVEADGPARQRRRASSAPSSSLPSNSSCSPRQMPRNGRLGGDPRADRLDEARRRAGAPSPAPRRRRRARRARPAPSDGLARRGPTRRRPRPWSAPARC